MTSERHRELLVEAYDGERFGAVLGRELAARTDDAALRDVYAAFERVEGVARDALVPLVERHGVRAGSDEQAEAAGVGLAEEMLGKTPADAWRDLLPAIERFVPLFAELGELGGPADADAIALLIAHEEASIDMARALIAGDHAAAGAALRGFLAGR